MESAAKKTITEDLAPMLEATAGAAVAEVSGWDRMKAALVWSDRKLMYDLFSGFTEIFDRTSDHEERHNLADTPTQLRIDMLAKLDAYLAVRACHQRLQISDKPWQ